MPAHHCSAHHQPDRGNNRDLQLNISSAETKHKGRNVNEERHKCEFPKYHWI